MKKNSDTTSCDMSARAFFISPVFIRDLAETVRLTRVWFFLGWLDVRLRYRRTVLGPFWMILSFAIIALAMGYIYATLFRVELASYLPYLISGLAVWSFLQTLINEGAAVFVSVGSGILENRLPLGLHVMRMLTRNTFVFFHSLAVVIPLTLFFGIRYDWESLAILPLAIVVFILNGIWFSLLFGMLCARFRDSVQIIQVVLHLVFFITPIFWQRGMLNERVYIADINPIYHLIEILRAPLLSQAPHAESWIFVAVLTLIGWVVTVVIASAWYRRLSYWL